MIHLPTSLKFFKNFDYRYYLLTIYTELQLNTAWINQVFLSQYLLTLIALSYFHTEPSTILFTLAKLCFYSTKSRPSNLIDVFHLLEKQ